MDRPSNGYEERKFVEAGSKDFFAGNRKDTYSIFWKNLMGFQRRRNRKVVSGEV